MLRIVLLVVALVAGAGAAWFALAMQPQLAVTTVVQPAPQAPTQEVLVASNDLLRGQVLSTDDMRWQAWPEGALSAAYITRAARAEALDALAGSIVRSGMIAGEPIREEKLAPLNAGFLSGILPSGKRAVAVRISAENTAGGFILPNDRVDVLNTVAILGQGEAQREHVSRTILRNVPVLAIDQTVDDQTSANGKDDKSKAKAAFLGKTATLELDAQQAETVTAAEATGTISLSLRSAADNGETPSVNLLAAKSQRTSQTIRVVRGGSSEIVTMR